MLLEIKNASVSLDGKKILNKINFRALDKEKIGIVGRNGSGKTTLLKVIEKEISIEKNDDETTGEIIYSGIKNIGYLSQITFSKLDRTVSEELDLAYDEGHKGEKVEEWEKQKAKNLSFLKFGFQNEEFNKTIAEFSGGEKTKIALIKLLLSNPDLLILDEPTNHLDIEAIEWLSSFLISYKKTVIVVSHDRQFLNDVCNVIYEIENENVVRYAGNYDYYVDKKAVDYETNLKTYEKASAEIKKLHGLYERFRYKPTKAKFAQSRLKMAEKLEKNNIPKPTMSSTESFRSNFTPKRVGGVEVLNIKNLTVGYDSNIVQNNFNMEIKRGERIGIIGRNGTGKSTILKTIVGKLPIISGEVKFGHEIDYEYFDQDIAKNDSIETVFDDFHNTFPKLSNTEVRTRLGNFLFEGDDVFKQVCVLSGGEKVRLCLAKMFERRPNFLILDEPTNHLDILGKEALENILDDYEGTCLFVSHDRYFVKRIATKVLTLTDINDDSNITSTNDSKQKIKINTNNVSQNTKNTDETNETLLSEYNQIASLSKKDEGDFIDYDDEEVVKALEKNSANKNIDNSNDDGNSKKVLSFEEQKERRRNESLLKKVEEKIQLLENEISTLETGLNDSSIQSDFEKLFELTNNISNKKNELSSLYDEWENISTLLN